jgi:anti-sigma factor RsiW
MSDEDLLGYLFDAVDAPEAERIERELESDPLARARLEELRRVNRLLAED